MTDDKRSQEAEDVSLRLVGDKDLLRDTLHGIVDCVDREGELYDEAKALRWLARLVREGQIRELQRVAAKVLCSRYCGGERWWPATRRDGGGWWHSNRMDDHISRSCEAPAVHARIAALRQEG